MGGFQDFIHTSEKLEVTQIYNTERTDALEHVCAWNTTWQCKRARHCQPQRQGHDSQAQCCTGTGPKQYVQNDSTYVKPNSRRNKSTIRIFTGHRGERKKTDDWEEKETRETSGEFFTRGQKTVARGAKPSHCLLL